MTRVALELIPIHFMRRLLIPLFSASWLFPVWISAQLFFKFLSLEIEPRLAGAHPLNSFPFLHFSFIAFTVGAVWLAAVIFFWAWRWSGTARATGGGV